MGLLDNDGKANAAAITAVANVHAGMFFDDLCDYGPDAGTMLTVITRLRFLLNNAKPNQVFLAICMVYNELRRPLPYVLWWISGSDSIVPIFTKQFVDRLSAILCQIQHEGGDSA